MNLQQMILETRRGLDGLSDSFWSDSEITSWLNEGAKIMCSAAQPLQGIYQVTLTASTQEYPLPTEVDEIYDVAFSDSTTTHLYRTQPWDVQTGHRGTGRPTHYYLRTVSNKTAGVDSNGVPSPALQNPGATQDFRLIIGLFPVPSAADTLTVSYFSRHYTMVNLYDTSPIPVEFHRGLVAYAIAQGKAKEEAYGEMNNVYLPMFKEFTDRLKEKMANDGQEQGFFAVKTDEDNLYPRQGGGVIFFGPMTG